MRLFLLLLPLLLGACEYVRPSPVGTNCVHQGRNPIPVCTN
ncbi:hypothetical protein [Paracraurococcus lichenis]|uniref:Lipoprotein n=1 Tax=Paracraurococcus lichenis TaxID=3064888 RepID=A0ABT9E2W5_9PROT|nr:hypothetical protein [Paracraurococcus sp. LOR1-02]MDO9710503.1 hypothetical protein [Paracraurococcus sp. LOR1-02]